MTNQNEIIQTTIIDESGLVDKTLSQMDLSFDTLQMAIRRGHAARANATEAHPVGSGGNFAYIETNGSLREDLIVKGWTSCNPNNIPLIRHPSGAFQIFASSGDEHTGSKLVSLSPATLREKGLKVSSLFEGNHRDLFDFQPADGLKINTKAEGSCPTWILLFHFDETTQTTKAEFSLPKPVYYNDGKNKHQVSNWKTRIILNEIGGDQLEPLEQKTKPEFTEDSDFEITSKLSKK